MVRMMDTPWRFELLGGFSIRQGERHITRFSTQKTGALLAFLAYYSHQTHTRDILITQLWPDVSGEAGRARLSTALSSLRRQLEPPGIASGAVICADRFTVRLNPVSITTDFAEFERSCVATLQETDPDKKLQLGNQALALYRGELLPGYYEDWVLIEQRRLSALYFQTISELVGVLERQGESERALAVLQQAIRIDPLREQSHYEWINLCRRMGQPAEALRQYAVLERLLHKERNTTPSLATRELAEALRHEVQTRHGERDKNEKARLAQNSVLPQKSPEEIKAKSANHSPPPSASTPRLPLQFTRFFGREAETAQLFQMLAPGASCQLVTLSGAGGTGKTRLSVEIARKLTEAYKGAVWFVTLTDLTDARLIPEAIRDALGLPRRADQDALEQAVTLLQGQPGLLILDNLEQLLPEATATVMALRNRCPHLSFLVTSRRRIALTGEREYPLSPLTLPNTASRTPEGLMQSASVQLFVDRAQGVKPDFQVTSGNAAAVAALCTKLEGVPLALELAAARIQTLTPAQILERLSHRFDLLISRHRDREARHMSLWAAIDWSYDLLPTPLQQFFAQMSVFRGSFSLEAAEAVSGESRALEYLTQLRERSLLLAEESASEMRYRLMESLREYGSEQNSPEEREQIATGHAVHYVAFAKEAQRHYGTPYLTSWLDRLEIDHENLRAALRWLQGDTSPAGTALRMAGYLWRFWSLRGYATEGRRWFRELLQQNSLPQENANTDAVHVRAVALTAAGSLAWQQNDLTEAYQLLSESLPLYRVTEDRQGLVYALIWLGNVAYASGDYAAAYALYEESRTIAEQIQERSAIAYALLWLGNTCLAQGDLETAAIHYQRSREIAEDIGDRQCTAFCYQNLGRMAWRQGNYDIAETLLKQALHLYREMGDKLGMIEVLESFSILALTRQQNQEAAFLFTSATKAREENGIPRRRSGMTDYEAKIEEVRHRMKQAETGKGEEHPSTSLEEAVRRIMEPDI